MAEFHVSSLAFTAEGVEFAFMELPGDVRNEGDLIRTRTYAVADNHPAYADQIRELREAVADLVRDIDEDWATAPVLVPHEELDEDAGMGSG